HARALLDDARDRGGRERPHSLVRDLFRNEASVRTHRTVITRDVGGEVCLRLEKLLEILVRILEDLEDTVSADHHQLHVQSDRLRCERRSGDDAELLAHVLEPYLLRAE